MPSKSLNFSRILIGKERWIEVVCLSSSAFYCTFSRCSFLWSTMRAEHASNESRTLETPSSLWPLLPWKLGSVCYRQESAAMQNQSDHTTIKSSINVKFIPTSMCNWSPQRYMAFSIVTGSKSSLMSCLHCKIWIKLKSPKHSQANSVQWTIADHLYVQVFMMGSSHVLVCCLNWTVCSSLERLLQDIHN